MDNAGTSSAWYSLLRELLNLGVNTETHYVRLILIFKFESAIFYYYLSLKLITAIVLLTMFRKFACFQL